VPPPQKETRQRGIRIRPADRDVDVVADNEAHRLPGVAHQRPQLTRQRLPRLVVQLVGYPVDVQKVGGDVLIGSQPEDFVATGEQFLPHQPKIVHLRRVPAHKKYIHNLK